MKPTILVTAIGTMASTTIVSKLRQSGEFHIIGADIYPPEWVATSKDVDEFAVFPPAIRDLENYIDFAVDFCKKHDVSYYFATIDEEIANLSRHRERFEHANVKLCIPNSRLVETCHYKNAFCGWIRENMPEIYIPTFDGPKAVGDNDLPVFVKPVEGRASLGCRRIVDRSQLDAMFASDADPRDYVIQKLVEGDVVTVDMIRNAATGQRLQIQRREYLRNASGCGIAVEILQDQALEAICDTLMEKLDLNGVVNAEFFRTPEGYRIIEINPRFSAGTVFSCMAGCDLAVNAVRIADGRECLFGSIKYGSHFAKRYECVCTD